MAKYFYIEIVFILILRSKISSLLFRALIIYVFLSVSIKTIKYEVMIPAKPFL